MNEELIRRSDAIKVVRHSSMEFIDADTRQKLIEALPTIEPKRGKWIDKGRHLWECSNCKMTIYSESERDRNEFHKWCSRCGADMRGKDDE